MCFSLSASGVSFQVPGPVAVTPYSQGRFRNIGPSTEDSLRFQVRSFDQQGTFLGGIRTHDLLTRSQALYQT